MITSGPGEVGDTVGAALGDAQVGRDIAQPAPGSWAMHISTRAWLVRKLKFAIIKQSTSYSSNILLVFNCGYRVRATPRDRPPDLPAGAGHVQRLIIIAWASRRRRGLRVRGMSSPGPILARHLLT